MFDFLRDRTKSSTEIMQEALNAYLDNALAPAERQRLERQLAQDARLRTELQQMRVLKQQLSQMPRRRVPRNFTLNPAVYGRPQRQPLLQLYPVLQGATALAALIFILVLGLGFFQGQFSGSLSEAALVEVTRIVTETTTEEQAVAEVPAAEEPAAEEPAAADSMAIESVTEEPAEELLAEAVVEEAELLQPAPLSGTLESEALPAELPAVGGALSDTVEAQTPGTEATIAAADGTDAAREAELAPTVEALADTDAFEFDAESADADVVNQPSAQPVGVVNNLITWQIALGVLLLMLIIILFVARRWLKRW